MPAEWAPHERCLISWPTAVARLLGRVLPARPGDARRGGARRRPLRAGARHRQPRRGRQRAQLLRLRQHRGRRAAHRRLLDPRQRPLLRARPRRQRARSPTSASTRGARSTCPTTRTRASPSCSASTSAGARFAAPMVLEGGAFTRRRRGHAHHDRELPAAPDAQPAARRASGRRRSCATTSARRRSIWLKAGRTEATDTDGHVDGVCHFVAPGRVILHMVHEPDHVDYENFRENRRRLDEATDARGRAIDVARDGPAHDDRHRRQAPDDDLRELLPGERRADRADRRQRPTTSTRSSGCARSSPTARSSACRRRCSSYGGGGIHCITQQVPARRRGSVSAPATADHGAARDAGRAAREPRLPPTAAELLAAARRIVVTKGYAEPHDAGHREGVGHQPLPRPLLLREQGGPRRGPRRHALRGPGLRLQRRRSCRPPPRAAAGAGAARVARAASPPTRRPARLLYELLPHILRSKKLRERVAELYAAYRAVRRRLPRSSGARRARPCERSRTSGRSASPSSRAWASRRRSTREGFAPRGRLRSRSGAAES